MSRNIELAQALPINEVLALSPIELMALQSDAESALQKVQSDIEWLNYILALIYKSEIKKLEDEGLEQVSTTLSVGNINIEISLEQEIIWDQDELKNIADHISISGDSPAEFMKVVYQVDEEKFESWALQLRSVFTSARTLTPQKPVVKFSKKREY